MQFKAFFKLFAAMVIILTTGQIGATEANKTTLDKLHLAIYKNQGCTCCDKWAEHLNQNHIDTDIEVSENLSQLKQQLGINPRLASCHTAVFEQNDKKYVFEGHIPAKFIKQFLANPPEGAIGLTVPAMPVGSPGMEYQNKFMPYKIFQINHNAQTSVYAEVNSLEEQY